MRRPGPRIDFDNLELLLWWQSGYRHGANLSPDASDHLGFLEPSSCPLIPLSQSHGQFPPIVVAASGFAFACPGLVACVFAPPWIRRPPPYQQAHHPLRVTPPWPRSKAHHCHQFLGGAPEKLQRGERQPAETPHIGCQKITDGAFIDRERAPSSSRRFAHRGQKESILFQER